MTRPRTLAIGLDGYEPSLGDALRAAGRMPHLSHLMERSARVELEHGNARYSGLAWEHVSRGLSPEAASRFSAVHFDADRYEARQRGSSGAPLLASLDLRAVIFDAPYFDLSRAPNCRGLVSWGAHDGGTPRQSRPDSLADEIESRFGPYPAEEFVYGFVWPDAERTRAMGDALERAVDARAAIGRWLLRERFPEWDFALLVVSELHSALEALWHGVDPEHPLHGIPSAKPAREGVERVYTAVDRLIGAIRECVSGAQVVVFSLHGMGPNRSDVPSMLLLPELLYRASHGRVAFEPSLEWATAPDGIPLLGAGASWSRAVLDRCAPRRTAKRSWRVRAQRAWRRSPPGEPTAPGEDLGWMPAARYRRCWSDMDAFALPSFYDGRVRINLGERERLGRVAPADYEARCDDVEALLAECRDLRTGEPVAAEIDRPVRGDPRAADPTQADLVIRWRGSALGFAHPRLGVIGPAPYRRTGGHAGGPGVGYFELSEAAPGDHGVRSAFDVVPTLLDLCGVAADGISGESLLPGLAPSTRGRAAKESIR